MDKNIKQAVEKIAGKTEEEKKEEVKSLLQLIVFEMDEEEYAVPIIDVKEIIKYTDITPIPNSPEFIKGILNLRGKIVVVIDLEKRFNLVREKKAEPRHIIIVDIEENTFGIIIDEVSGVMRVPENVVQSTPSLVSSKIKSDYLKGVVVLKEGEKSTEKDKEEKQESGEKSRLIILLDMPKMLKESELLSIGESVSEVKEDLESKGSKK